MTPSNLPEWFGYGIALILSVLLVLVCTAALMLAALAGFWGMRIAAERLRLRWKLARAERREASRAAGSGTAIEKGTLAGGPRSTGGSGISSGEPAARVTRIEDAK